MNSQEIHTRVLRVLGQIAPEADLSAIKPDIKLRDQLDIDSMDFLNFLIGVDKELSIAIPERDYGQLTTLDACVAYLMAHQENRTS
jgi:acyl carrier protein